MTEENKHENIKFALEELNLEFEFLDKDVSKTPISPHDWISDIICNLTSWSRGYQDTFTPEHLKEFTDALVSSAAMCLYAARDYRDTIEISKGLGLNNFNLPAVKTNYPNLSFIDLTNDEGHGIDTQTSSMSLAIVANDLKRMGYTVYYVNGPVIMYQGQALAVMSYDYDADYTFVPPGTMTAFLYQAYNKYGEMDAGDTDLTSLTKIRGIFI